MKRSVSRAEECESSSPASLNCPRVECSPGGPLLPQGRDGLGDSGGWGKSPEAFRSTTHDDRSGFLSDPMLLGPAWSLFTQRRVMASIVARPIHFPPPLRVFRICQYYSKQDPALRAGGVSALWKVSCWDNSQCASRFPRLRAETLSRPNPPRRASRAEPWAANYLTVPSVAVCVTVPAILPR